MVEGLALRGLWVCREHPEWGLEESKLQCLGLGFHIQMNGFYQKQSRQRYLAL